MPFLQLLGVLRHSAGQMGLSVRVHVAALEGDTLRLLEEAAAADGEPVLLAGGAVPLGDLPGPLEALLLQQLPFLHPMTAAALAAAAPTLAALLSTPAHLLPPLLPSGFPKRALRSWSDMLAMDGGRSLHIAHHHMQQQTHVPRAIASPPHLRSVRQRTPATPSAAAGGGYGWSQPVSPPPHVPQGWQPPLATNHSPSCQPLDFGLTPELRTSGLSSAGRSYGGAPQPKEVFASGAATRGRAPAPSPLQLRRPKQAPARAQGGADNLFNDLQAPGLQHRSPVYWQGGREDMQDELEEGGGVLFGPQRDTLFQPRIGRRPLDGSPPEARSRQAGAVPLLRRVPNPQQVLHASPLDWSAFVEPQADRGGAGALWRNSRGAPAGRGGGYRIGSVQRRPYG